VITKQEFLWTYHEYTADTQEEAEAEAVKVNAEGILDPHNPGNKAVAVNFPGLGWCVMLESAVKMLEEIRLFPTQEHR